jgi:hypothetical protein
MRKLALLLFILASYHISSAQKVEAIYFNLYTDSLKKGFYNYINVDGKLSDGKWKPLGPDEVILTSNTGRFEGNDLFIDSSYKHDSVVVKAVLKNNPSVWKEVTIYLRKRGFTEPLPSNEDILNDFRKPKKKHKQNVT